MKKLLGAAVFPTCTDCALWNVSTDLSFLTILMSSFIGLVTYWLSSFQPSDVHPTLLIVFFRIFVKISLDQTFLFSAATM